MGRLADRSSRPKSRPSTTSCVFGSEEFVCYRKTNLSDTFLLARAYAGRSAVVRIEAHGKKIVSVTASTSSTVGVTSLHPSSRLRAFPDRGAVRLRGPHLRHGRALRPTTGWRFYTGATSTLSQAFHLGSYSRRSASVAALQFHQPMPQPWVINTSPRARVQANGLRKRSIAAAAHSLSWAGVPELTPTAPTTWPSTRTGIPPATIDKWPPIAVLIP